MRSDMAKVLVRSGPEAGGGSGRSTMGYRKDLPAGPRPRTGGRGRGSRIGGAAGRNTRATSSARSAGSCARTSGRPWDVVYSEICAGPRQGFPAREQFLGHVYRFVEQARDPGRRCPCHGRRHRYHGTPLQNHGGRYFYVCPKIGPASKQVPESEEDDAIDRTEGPPDWRRDPLGKRASDEPCGFDSRPFRCRAGAARAVPDSMVPVV